MELPRRQFMSTAMMAAAARTVLGSPAVFPTLNLGGHKVSRLIIGENPFYGHSHFNIILSRLMREWSTPERVCEILRRCEAEGINTWEFTHRRDKLSDFHRHRAAGGKMQFILLSSREMGENHDLIPEMAKLKPIGIAHHGGITDRFFRAGESHKTLEFLKKVRDSGVLVGLSTHNPAVVEMAEERNWDVDFYMTCLYQINRTPEEVRKLLGQIPITGEGDLYLPDDPARMCRVIRQTRKTCLAFKLLASGRLIGNPARIDEAFQFTLSNIKPQDGIIVGMFPKYSDEVHENAERTRRFLGAT